MHVNRIRLQQGSKETTTEKFSYFDISFIHNSLYTRHHRLRCRYCKCDEKTIEQKKNLHTPSPPLPSAAEKERIFHVKRKLLFSSKNTTHHLNVLRFVRRAHPFPHSIVCIFYRFSCVFLFSRLNSQFRSLGVWLEFSVGASSFWRSSTHTHTHIYMSMIVILWAYFFPGAFTNEICEPNAEKRQKKAITAI